jgi:predicted nucleotidyltransferase
LLELATLERNLSESLGIKVDLLTENALSPHMADKVHEEMMVIYE